MITTTNNNQNLNLLDESTYLVTQAVIPSTLPSAQVQSDLGLLKQAEAKAINHGNSSSTEDKNPQVSRAMQALRLANPFKGY